MSPADLLDGLGVPEPLAGLLPPTQLLAVALTVPLGVALGLAVLLVPGGAGVRARWVPLVAAAAAGVSALALVAARLGESTGAAAALGWRFSAVADVDLVLSSGPAYAVVLAPLVAAVTVVCLVVASTRAELCTVRFSVLVLGFLLSALVTVLATNLLTLLLAWELMGAASWALVGYRWADPDSPDEASDAAHGARTAFLVTRCGDLGLYLAVGAAVAGGVVGLRLDDLAGATPGWRHVIAAGLLAAALGKAAQLPFSFWLRGAMAGPAPVSALLHSAAMVALGTYLLLRVSPLLEAVAWAGPVTAWVGVATAVVMGAVAVAQDDLKDLLAASTAAQLGFVVMAAGLGATGSGLAHLLVHACVKATLFLVAGVWLWQVGSRRLVDLRGAVRRSRAVGPLALVALLALGGVPPLSLWLTKDSILHAAAESSTALQVAGLLATGLAAAYVARVLGVVLQGPQPGQPDLVPETRAAAALQPLVVVAALGGVLVLPGVSGLLPGVAPTLAPVTELVVSAVLVLVVLTVVFVLEASEPAAPRTHPVWRGLQDWAGLERAAHALLVRPLGRVAEALARADDALARGADAAGPATRRLAAATATGDTAGVDRVVRLTVSGSQAASRLLRRPGTTGQLHHYYALAVLVLGVVLVAAVTATLLT